MNNWDFINSKEYLLWLWSENMITSEELFAIYERIDKYTGTDSKPWIYFYEDEDCDGLECPYCGHQEYPYLKEEFVLRNRKCPRCFSTLLGYTKAEKVIGI